MRKLGFIRQASQDRRGVTVTEFGLIAPTFLIMLLGVFDLGFTVYARAILDGAVQKAGRDASLESGPSALATIDARVRENLGPLGKDAEINPVRMSYQDFAKVGLPEDFEDENSNGTRDPGECFTDVNSNGIWDADLGKQGVGGARDVVLYTVSMRFKRKFPLYGLIGADEYTTIKSATVLRNQPYDAQIPPGSENICT